MIRSSAERTFSVGVVILGAGRSARMGQPKLLLPWGGTSVLGHLIEQWQALGARQIAIVCAARDQTMQMELDRLSFAKINRICNPAPEGGMFSSIQCAVRWPGWQSALTHWAIVLGDQPLFLQLADSTAPTLKEFLAAKPGEVALCEVDDAGTEVDIDRPDDYAKAVALDVIRRAGR